MLVQLRATLSGGVYVDEGLFRGFPANLSVDADG